GYDPQHWQHVAAVVRRAQAEDRGIYESLTVEFGASKSTVRNWVFKARRLGLLDDIAKTPSSAVRAATAGRPIRHGDDHW
ncbi:MAG TPA: hypothetical protein PLV68_05500, partial [Ilumatobacteraceae bacterium]|nr:hypothetical protein [Ilumatobacteraceae bacterium]